MADLKCHLSAQHSKQRVQRLKDSLPTNAVNSKHSKQCVERFCKQCVQQLMDSLLTKASKHSIQRVQRMKDSLPTEAKKQATVSPLDESNATDLTSVISKR